MAIRSTRLWGKHSSSTALQSSPAVPPGHVWIVKSVVVRNNGAGTTAVEAGIHGYAESAYFDLIYTVGLASGAILTLNGFFVAVVSDTLYLQLGTAVDVSVSFHGADLS